MERRSFLRLLAALSWTPLGALGLARISRAEAPAPAKIPRLDKPLDEWRELLSEEAFAVLFEEATEPPGSSPLNHEKRAGTYVCAACKLPLFESTAKFDSGTGWPSFTRPIPGRVETKRDFRLVIPRTEYHCARCGGHQGHVFEDGPPPTGQRWCNNGVALQFVPEGEPLPDLVGGGQPDTRTGAGEGGQTDPANAIATFAGGCFWCMEKPFDRLDGVLETTVGYTGGHTKDPSYQDVSSGRTGHAEAVQIRFDPARIGYERLLEVFWRNVDPLTPNAQFCDHGSQYRAAIFAHDDEQLREAQASKRALEASGRFPQPIVTGVERAGPFYAAEEYHQDYAEKNPIRYRFYRHGCGRDARLEALWGDEAGGAAD